MLTLLIPLALAETPDPLAEQPEPWDYPAPTLWFSEFQSAEEELEHGYARWLRHRVLAEGRLVSGAEIQRTIASYEMVLMNLEARRAVLTQSLSEVQESLARAKSELTLANSDPAVIDRARAEMQVRIDEQAARAEQGVRALRTHLLSLGADALVAREDLDRWWSARQGVRWHLVASGSEETALARVDEARLNLQISVQGLGDAARQLTESALAQGSSEDQLRRDMETMVRRLENPNDPFRDGALRDQIRQLEVLASTNARRLSEVMDAVDEAQRELSSLRAAATGLTGEEGETGEGGAPGASSEVEADLRKLRVTYDRLYLGMSTLEARLDADSRCRVQVHAALLRVLLGEDGAEPLLRQAAAAYGGACEPVASAYLENTMFGALWGQAALRLSREEPAHLLMNPGPGVWTLDGAPLVGGPMTVTLSPGVHRLGYTEEGRVLHQEERIDAGERLCVSVSAQGDVALDPCAFGEEADLEGLPPVRAPWGGRLGPDDPDPELPPARRVFVASSGQWLRVPGPELPVDTLGGTLQVGWRLGPSAASPLALGLAQDLAWSPEPLNVSRDLAAGLVMRSRLCLGWRPDRRDFNPLAELSAGFLLASDAADGASLPPPVVDLTLGARLRMSDTLRLQATGGLSYTALADEPFSPQPVLRVGLIRWL